MLRTLLHDMPVGTFVGYGAISLVLTLAIVGAASAVGIAVDQLYGAVLTNL